MPRLALVLLGPAGSGKTLLTRALGRWLEESGFSVDYVNLDPAAEALPYEPSFDARRIVRARDLMESEGLGPNGAIIRAMDLLAESAALISRELSKLGGDYVLVDTPGQVEVLMFRSSGLRIAQAIKESTRPVGVFLLDSTLGTRGAEIAVSVLMAAVAQLRLEIPVVPVLSKSDASGLRGGLVSPSIHLEVDEVAKGLAAESHGTLSEMLLELIRAARRYLRSERLIAVSSVTGDGLEDLYKLIHEVFCVCGDLT